MDSPTLLMTGLVAHRYRHQCPQFTAGIGGAADMDGHAAADDSDENDPLQKSGGQNCCNAQHGFFHDAW